MKTFQLKSAFCDDDVISADTARLAVAQWLAKNQPENHVSSVVADDDGTTWVLTTRGWTFKVKPYQGTL